MLSNNQLSLSKSQSQITSYCIASVNYSFININFNILLFRRTDIPKNPIISVVISALEFQQNLKWRDLWSDSQKFNRHYKSKGIINYNLIDLSNIEIEI
jgi:hypothetical protein